MKNTTKTAERVKRGMVQQVQVKFDGAGRATETPLSDWRPITDADRARWASNIAARTK